jgi:small GTP-binding protein
MPDTLKVAVVGHANSGKTSLMRTLLRDVSFGEVSDSPGTTRHVEGGALLVEGRTALELFDTPGLEDSIRLLELLELDVEDQTDGIERLQRFLSKEANFPQFRQEAKVIRQLLRSEVSFYVIDIREPVLGKYLDELKIIGFAARPVIPVLNFFSPDQARLTVCRDQLAPLGLHATV